MDVLSAQTSLQARKATGPHPPFAVSLCNIVCTSKYVGATPQMVPEQSIRSILGCAEDRI